MRMVAALRLKSIYIHLSGNLYKRALTELRYFTESTFVAQIEKEPKVNEKEKTFFIKREDSSLNEKRDWAVFYREFFPLAVVLL